jgi:hypothetical protein
MRESHVMVADALSAELDALYRRHGSWSLLRALAGTVVRRSLRPKANHTADLDNHMRRDIGMSEIAPDIDYVLQARFEQWRHYL